jgi:hypothetical protein
LKKIINPNQPNSCEGTSFACLNVDSNNVESVDNAIISVNDELGIHVSLTTKQKIMKGEFIEL